MKKLLAILLAMMLVMVSAVALATEADPETIPENETPATDNEVPGNTENNEDNNGNTETPVSTDYKDKLDVVLTLPKTYTINHGTAPAETFTFKFTGVSYKNGAGVVSTAADAIPPIANQTIAFDAISATTNDSFTLGFDVDDYKLGVYTYEIEEVIPEPKTAGVTYQTDKMYLVLTVLSEGTATKHFVAALHKGSVDGSKTDSVQNSYDAGTLEVEKETTGNLADLDKPFTFTITFAAENGTQITAAQKEAIGIEITGETTGTWAEDSLTYTIALKNGEKVKFSNLPVGTTYDVSENAEEYASNGGVFSAADKTIVGGVDQTAKITNTLNVAIDTGVSMDSVPYMVLMAIALIGGAVLFLRKREEY